MPELVIGASNVLTFRFTDKYDRVPRVLSDPFKIYLVECGLVASMYLMTQQYMSSLWKVCW